MKPAKFKENDLVHDIDLKILTDMLYSLIDVINNATKPHDTIRELYHTNRMLWREINKKAFPISYLYHLSLEREMLTTYVGFSCKEIAAIENVSERTIYNHRKALYHYEKQDKEKSFTTRNKDIAKKSQKKTTYIKKPNSSFNRMNP